MKTRSPQERLEDLARRWNVAIGDTDETPSSLIAYGKRRDAAVVLKVVKQHGDEWLSGAVLEALRGPSVVRVLEHEGGAVLMERMLPGRSLVDVVLEGRDDDATRILGDVIAAMPVVKSHAAAPTVDAWGSAFEWYFTSNDDRLPAALVQHARDCYRVLCETQGSRRLLHGDLQHSNVVFDATRGWMVLDAKGVVGELEFEIGAAMRNPWETPDLVTDLETVQNRIAILCQRLELDRERTLAWTFAQAVLSAVWSIQDGDDLAEGSIVLRLAAAVEPLIRLST